MNALDYFLRPNTFHNRVWELLLIISKFLIIHCLFDGFCFLKCNLSYHNSGPRHENYWTPLLGAENDPTESKQWPPTLIQASSPSTRNPPCAWWRYGFIFPPYNILKSVLNAHTFCWHLTATAGLPFAAQRLSALWRKP